MKCLYPITIRNPHVSTTSPEQFIKVPCGHCAACCGNLAQEWSVRLYEEQKRWRYWAFATLTYSPSCNVHNSVGFVEYSGHDVELFTLNKSDFKSFICKIRRSKIPFRYFLSGEYGEKSLRNHGHCIFFFDDPSIIQVINNSWSFGFVYFTRDISTGLKYCVRSLSLNSAIQYATKYSCKRSSHPFFYSEDGSWNSDLAQRPFRLMSKNLGSNFFDSDHFKLLASQDPDHYHDFCDLVQYPKPTVRGTVNVPLPRYYKDKIFVKRFNYEVEVDGVLSPSKDVSKESHSVTIRSSLGIMYKTALQIRSDRKYKTLLSSGFSETAAQAITSGEDSSSVSLRQEKLSKLNELDYLKSKF